MCAAARTGTSWAALTGVRQSLGVAWLALVVAGQVTPAVTASGQRVAGAFTASGLIPVRVNFASHVDTAFNATASAS